ncbi:MAG TPA: multicopper oxidase family protein [Stellaceae bacterium]|nr:multicopper oxidase family protein [Stellaceae bacterium]
MDRRAFLMKSTTFGVGALSWALNPPMPARAAERDTLDITLEARPFVYPPATGTHFHGLAYNGQVPGPLLRLRHGQKLHARFVNRTGGPSTIHWHGMILPNAMDGVPDVTQPAVPNGGEFIYAFKPDPPGLRWYHSHVSPQLALGLFGAIVVEDPTDPPADLDVVLILHDVPDMKSYAAAMANTSTAPMDLPPGAPELAEMAGMKGMAMPTQPPAGGDMSGMNMPGKAIPSGKTHAEMGDEVFYIGRCINGAAYPHGRPIIARIGQTVRLRILNASPTATHYVRLAGHRLKVTHSDGNPLPRSVVVDVLRLGPAERYDAWVEITRPGAWLLESLSSRPRDLRQAVVVRTPDAAHAAPERPPASFDGSVYFTYALAGEAAPAAMTKPEPATDVSAHFVLGGGKWGDPRWTINDKTWPDTPKIRVHSGDRVEVRFTNQTDMDHPMHLHGHVFELTSIDGERLKFPLPKDTTLVRANGGTAVWRFTASSPPGRWLLHCHNEVHMMGGMMTEVDYI